MSRSAWSWMRPLEFFGRNRCKNRGSWKGSAARKPRGLHLEPLEDRQLLSVCTWDGQGSDNKWQTAANWVGNVAPVAGDQLVFAGTTQTATQDDYTAGTTFQSIEFQNSGFTLSGNSLVLTGNITVDTGATNSTIALGVGLSGPVNMNVADSTSLTLSGVLSDGSSSGSLAVNDTGTGGTGTVSLTGTNTYTGGTMVNGGTLTFGAGGSAGVIQGNLTINSGATVEASTDWSLGWTSGTCVSSIDINGGTLQFYGGNTDGGTSASAITMAGGTIDGSNFDWYDGITTTPTLTTSDSATISSGINLRLGSQGYLTTDVAQGADLTVSGAINTSSPYGGGGGLVKTDTGLLSLSATNTYSGGTTVNGGTLYLGSGGQAGVICGRSDDQQRRNGRGRHRLESRMDKQLLCQQHHD